MGKYLSEIWQCRYFWWSLVKMDLRTRYRRSVLGLGWSLLHPICLTIILCFVFGNILGVGIRDYGPYLLAGLVTWNFISGVTVQGCQSFFQGETYIRQHPAPLAVYPLRTALGGTVHFLMALIVVLGLSWCMHGFGNVPSLIYLFPGIVLLFILCWSLAVLSASANVLFQDTQHLSEIGFQILFYATPIMYMPQTLESARLGWFLHINPAVPLLALVRHPILEGHAPSLGTYCVATTIVLLFASAAGLTLSRVQRQLIFHL
jgi:ABC-type polysaccharide/polyol phosphate export permease